MTSRGTEPPPKHTNRDICLRTLPSKSVDERVLRPPERPATAPRPGRFVQPEPVTERVPAVAEERRPSDGRVAGGVTDRRAPEVDDGAQAAVDDQQIGAGHVSVDPDRRACKRDIIHVHDPEPPARSTRQMHKLFVALEAIGVVGLDSIPSPRRDVPQRGPTTWRASSARRNDGRTRAPPSDRA